jgi:DHA2 family multidrug resistance protein
MAQGPMPAKGAHRPFDWIGFSLISVTFFCLTYVLTQGSRWDWFEEPRILWLTVIVAAPVLVAIKIGFARYAKARIASAHEG